MMCRHKPYLLIFRTIASHDLLLFIAETGDQLRLRGIMIGRHFQANMKVQTTMCKDNSNSKSRAATCVKFDIYIK